MWKMCIRWNKRKGGNERERARDGQTDRDRETERQRETERSERRTEGGRRERKEENDKMPQNKRIRGRHLPFVTPMRSINRPITYRSICHGITSRSPVTRGAQIRLKTSQRHLQTRQYKHEYEFKNHHTHTCTQQRGQTSPL